MKIARTEPILPSRDLEETRNFYVKLGFIPWWKDPVPWEYAIYARGHLVVHFFAESALDPSKNDVSCYWRVKDADRFYREYSKLGLPSDGIPRLTAPVNQPWGMREFTIVDPSGNQVRVGHDLDPKTAYVPSDSEE